jgi:hypothetical protein
MTACCTVSPRYSSATRFISRSTMPEISGIVYTRPATRTRTSLFGPCTSS